MHIARPFRVPRSCRPPPSALASYPLVLTYTRPTPLASRVASFGVDDYIIAAIELYLDVINLFLCVLQCLTLCGSR